MLNILEYWYLKFPFLYLPLLLLTAFQRVVLFHFCCIFYVFYSRNFGNFKLNISSVLFLLILNQHSDLLYLTYWGFVANLLVSVNLFPINFQYPLSQFISNLYFTCNWAVEILQDCNRIYTELNACYLQKLNVAICYLRRFYFLSVDLLLADGMFLSSPS